MSVHQGGYADNAYGRSRRAVGLPTAVGAFLAFGMTAVVAAPQVSADFGFDDLLDPASWFSSTTWTDAAEQLFNPAALEHGNLPTGIDGLPATAAGGAGDDTGSGLNLAEVLHHDIYLPLHQAIEDWVDSPFGSKVDSVINAPFTTLTGRGLIDNGAAGTEAHPDGGDGGWLFGDGGAGWNSTEAGVAGGNGGDAVLFGNGGGRWRRRSRSRRR